MSLAVDLSPLFTAINTWFPAMFGILAIGGGIMIALRLGQYLIESVSRAFG